MQSLFVILVIDALRGRFARAQVILTWSVVLPAAMMLTGAVPWQYSGSPGLVLSLCGPGLVADLDARWRCWSGRRARVPTAIAAAAITVAAFTVDAALGAVMQPGSLLNSRPIFGLRWYGFGNVTFAGVRQRTDCCWPATSPTVA